MTKNQAIKLFGTVEQLAAALGVTRHAIYMWPNGKLNPRTVDQVTGAAYRLGHKLPLKMG